MKVRLRLLAAFGLAASPTVLSQDFPGSPEDNGLTPLTDTIYINEPDETNNGNTESLGVGVAGHGLIIVGWEDDAADDASLEYLGSTWTVYNRDGGVVTIEKTIGSLANPDAGTAESRFLSYFRTDESATPANTAWGPKIKASLFGNEMGMGATAYALGAEVPELEDINRDDSESGVGDFPAVQLIDAGGEPTRIVTGATDADAQPAGDIRIADWESLANGNLVVVGENRQEDDLVNRFGGDAPARHCVYRILNSAGEEVREFSLLSETTEAVEMWYGVGATRDGWAARFSIGGRAKIRLFDNEGNPTSGNIDIGELTSEEATAGGGRGDGTGFHGNGADAYVVVNSGPAPEDFGLGQNVPWVTVINADGTHRYTRIASDDFEFANSDRVDAAIDAVGRVIVVWADNDAVGGIFRLVQARLFGAYGNSLSGTFFVSEREDFEDALDEGRRPRVAWRGDTIAVVWQSRNSDETTDEVVALRTFEIPEVKPAPPIVMVWEHLFNDSNGPLPILQAQGEVVDVSDGTGLNDTYGGFKRYDESRLLLGIRENGIDETDPDHDAGLAAQYPDRSLIWIDPDTGVPMGIALTVGYAPVELDQDFIDAGGSASDYYFNFGVSDDGAVYVGYKNKIVRYAPDGQGGFAGPTVAYTQEEDGSANWHQWRWENIRVEGAGSATLIITGGKNWRPNLGYHILETDDGATFRKINDDLAQNVGGGGGASSILTGMNPDNPDEEWVYVSFYPGSSNGIDTRFNRRIGDLEGDANFTNDGSFRAAKNPAPDGQTDYATEFISDIDGHSALHYLVAYSTPSWNSDGVNRAPARPGFLALHSHAGGEVLRTHRIEARETEELEFFDGELLGTSLWHGTLGSVQLNRLDGMAEDEAEILWYGGIYGYGRYLVGEAAPTQPSMSIGIEGGRITISWEPATGTLEQADTVSGEYQAVPDASNPYTTQATAKESYYRVKSD